MLAFLKRHWGKILLCGILAAVIALLSLYSFGAVLALASYALASGWVSSFPIGMVFSMAAFTLVFASIGIIGGVLAGVYVDHKKDDAPEVSERVQNQNSTHAYRTFKGNGNLVFVSPAKQSRTKRRSELDDHSETEDTSQVNKPVANRTETVLPTNSGVAARKIT